MIREHMVVKRIIQRTRGCYASMERCDNGIVSTVSALPTWGLVRFHDPAVVRASCTAACPGS